MTNFRKIVSNLPFSPNLIGQLSFYYRRLKKEEFTRRIGVIITILALIVQSFAIIAPPTPTLAASNNDIIYGGVQSGNDIINAYNTNKQNFKDILNAFGIYKSDLQSGRTVNISYNDHNGQLYSIGRNPYGFKSEYPITIPNGQTYYMRKLAEWGNYQDKAWQFQAHGETFMILFHCGNLITIGQGHLYQPKPVIDGSCTVSVSVTGGVLRPDQQFKANFTATNKSNVDWGTYYGPGTKNAYVLGTISPLDNLTFGRNRVGIPGHNSAYGPILDAGKTASFSETFKAPSKEGSYKFAWRLLQEGKITQIGTSCNTTVTVKKAPPPPPEICKYNPSLKPTDKNCVPPCQYNKSILSTDKNCVPPCKYNANILSNSKDCVPPPPEVCKYNSNLKPTDKNCVPPCQYNSSILSTSSDCAPPCKYNAKILSTDKDCTAPVPEVCKYNSNLKPTDKDCVPPCQYNPNILSNSKDCVPPEPTKPTPPPTVIQPCQYDASLTSNDSNCTPCAPSNPAYNTNCLVLSKSVTNKTQDIVKADGTTAHAGDVLIYTLNVKNTGQQTQSGFSIYDNISDILDYAALTDMNGGQLDQETNIISWAAVDIQPGETISKTFVVRVKDPVPQTPTSASNPGTFDLNMTNVYGNTVDIKLPASIPKATEQVVERLPSTGAGMNIIIECALLVIVTYFYMRSRQLITETTLVRNEFSQSGGI